MRRHSNSKTLKDRFFTLRSSAETLYMSLAKRFVQNKGDKDYSLVVVDNPIFFKYYEMGQDDYQFVWAKYFAITREGWAILVFPDEQSFIERKDPIRIWLSDGTTENVLSLIRLSEELEKELSKQPQSH